MFHVTKRIHTRKPKKIYRYKRIEFWAENGVVMVYDGRNGTTKEVTALEFKKRGESFQIEYAVEHYKDEANALAKLACDVIEVVAQALKQGDPTNPKVSREMANLASFGHNYILVGGSGRATARPADPRPGQRLIIPGQAAEPKDIPKPDFVL